MSFTVIKGYDDVEESRHDNIPTFDEAVNLAQVRNDLTNEETAELRDAWYWSASDKAGGVDWVSIEGPGRPETSGPSLL